MPFLDQFEIVDFQLVQDLNLWQLLASVIFWTSKHLLSKIVKTCFVFLLFTDMLHDSERNKMYYEGLKAAIALKRSQGQPVHVLDIGTGTGLLSMMAAKIGADSITAIEEFLPMANRAEKIIRDNGFQGL